MNGAQAVERARSLFLEEGHGYGCAETALCVLKEAFELPDPSDPSAAMALNGGIAYAGDACGAISGSAIAAGLLAGRRIPDHALAKRTARRVTSDLISGFRSEFGSISCRELTGRDLGTKKQHDEFIASGIWRSTCLRQIEFAVYRLAALAEPDVWAGVVETEANDAA